MDVHFEVLHRRGTVDTPIASWDHHFDPLGGGVYTAQAFDGDATGTAVDYQPGDQLVFKFTGQSSASENAYIPNGDGVRAHGRIPNLTLP